MIFYVFIFILNLISFSLFAQEKGKLKIMQSYPIPITVLKISQTDSLRFTRVPDLIYRSARLKNEHIENPAVRYALEKLTRDRSKYYELKQAINTLRGYAENEHIKYMINYLRAYFETIGEKEKAIRQLRERIQKDSLEYRKRNPMDSVRYDILLNQDLQSLLTFMEEDENYRWMREKSRDSIPLIILNASDKPNQVWLNRGKTYYYYFSTKNIAGDSVGSWLRVSSRGNRVKFFVDENMYRKYDQSGKKTKDIGLKLQDSAYLKLKPLTPIPIKRNYWRYYWDISFAFGQGYFSDSWASGGENSLSILSDLKYFLNYKKNSLSWENAFRYRLGALKSGKEELSKNEDKFEILSKLGVKAFKHWNYAAQFDMNTVLFRTHNYPKNDQIIANFLSPGYFTISLGLDYKPKNNISLYLSPIAGQWIYVRDTARVDPTRYGVEKGKRYRSDAGAKVELRDEHEFFKFLKIDNRLIIFSSYYEKPEYITVDWRLSLDFKINYFMKTSVYMNAIYDQNYSKKIQFKETLNLGIYFRF